MSSIGAAGSQEPLFGFIDNGFVHLNKFKNIWIRALILCISLQTYSNPSTWGHLGTSVRNERWCGWQIRFVAVMYVNKFKQAKFKPNCFCWWQSICWISFCVEWINTMLTILSQVMHLCCCTERYSHRHIFEFYLFCVDLLSRTGQQIVQICLYLWQIITFHFDIHDFRLPIFFHEGKERMVTLSLINSVMTIHIVPSESDDICIYSVLTAPFFDIYINTMWYFSHSSEGKKGTSRQPMLSYSKSDLTSSMSFPQALRQHIHIQSSGGILIFAISKLSLRWTDDITGIWQQLMGLR